MSPGGTYPRARPSPAPHLDRSPGPLHRTAVRAAGQAVAAGGRQTQRKRRGAGKKTAGSRQIGEGRERQDEQDRGAERQAERDGMGQEIWTRGYAPPGLKVRTPAHTKHPGW